MNKMSIKEAAAKLRTQELSPVELTQMCLKRIHEVEKNLNAFVMVTEDLALQAAREAESEIAARNYRGPLHGIPVAVKDLCDMAGLPTTCSSKVRRGHQASSDAAIVERLKKAGAVIVGKTHTHEFAYGIATPTTRNPWNTRHIPGGSSGGTAATVAARGCFGGIGTDTGGSIRIPAALCGIVGLKPSYGRVSRFGVASLSWSLDHVGPMTRTVEDAALMLGVLAGYDPRDPGSVDLPVPDYTQDLDGSVRGLRLGVPNNYYFDQMDDETSRLVEEAFAVLEKIGIKRVSVALPLAEHYMAVEFGLCLPEASAYHQHSLRTSAHLYEDDVRTFLEVGELIPATDYIKALRVREKIKQGWAELLGVDGVDALLAPAVPADAAKVGQESFTWLSGLQETITSAYVRHSCPANLTGLPSIAVPCGFTRRGLPVGIQIIGRAFDEPTILRLARAYEAETNWGSRAPPL